MNELEVTQLKLAAAIHALRWIEFSPFNTGVVDMQIHAGDWVQLINSATPELLSEKLNGSEYVYELYQRKRGFTKASAGTGQPSC